MAKLNYKCKKSNPRHAISKVKDPIEYSANYFGFSREFAGDGTGVRICIIDTGLPKSKFLRTPITNAIDFTGTSVYDNHGHSTGVAGVIAASATGNIRGIAPKSMLWYAKAIGDDGQGEHGAVQASVLYAIVQRVDIIVMSFGCEAMHPSLKDAIKKAYNSGICIFAAAGNEMSKTKDADFPARLPEVMSVGLCDKGKAVQTGTAEAPAIDLSMKSIYTTYLDDRFIKMGGTSIAAPVVASVAACYIQRQRIKQGNVDPANVYEKLMASVPS